MSASEIVTEAAAVASAAVPVAAAISPLAGTIVALVAAALKAEPAVVTLIEQVIADFKGSAAPQVPLDFKEQSAALDAKLHVKLSKAP